MATDNEGRGGRKNNANKGALFTNKDDNPHPNAPGYRGRVTFECPCCHEQTEMQISAWVQTAGEQAKHPGEKYLQMKFEEKQLENQGQLGF